MLQNVGSVDRVVRILVGAELVAASVLGAIGSWGWFGVIPLATGVFGSCPAYVPFRLSTRSAKPGNTKP